MYEEGISILYYDLSISGREVEIRVRPDGVVFLLGHRISPGNFSAIRRIKKLRLHVSWDLARNPFGVCNIQDAMFALFGCLDGASRLQTLSVDLERVYSDGECIAPHAHWDMTPRHVIAFLLDALCTVRGIKLGKGKSNFRLEFPGNTTRPWSQMEGRVRKEIEGQSIPPDYMVFCNYFATLRKFKVIADRFLKLSYVWNPLVKLAISRIEGDMTIFHNSHGLLLEHLESLHNRLLCGQDVSSSAASVEECDRWVDQMISLSQLLHEQLVPANTDTSDFGHNVASKAQREWKLRGRYEEEQAKARRKRERQAAGDAKRQRMMGSEED